MALINCPECNNEISSTCKVCPRCGYRLKKVEIKDVGKATKGILNFKIPNWAGILIIIAIFGIFGIVSYSNHVAHEKYEFNRSQYNYYEKEIQLLDQKITKCEDALKYADTLKSYETYDLYIYCERNGLNCTKQVGDSQNINDAKNKISDEKLGYLEKKSEYNREMIKYKNIQ